VFGRRRRLEDREGEPETVTPGRDRATQYARYVVSYNTLSAANPMRGGLRGGDATAAASERRKPSEGEDGSQAAGFEAVRLVEVASSQSTGASRCGAEGRELRTGKAGSQEQVRSGIGDTTRAVKGRGRSRR
jgi:hypothetical protein